MTFDMTKPDNLEVAIPWNGFGPLYHLRFDPMESTPAAVAAGANWYSVDWVKLTAKDEIFRGNKFSIRYVVENDLPGVNLKLYYDADTNPGNGRTLIWDRSSGSINSETVGSVPPQIMGNSNLFLPFMAKNYQPPLQPCSENCYSWDTSQISYGEYYICAEAADSLNMTYRCSASPVVVR